MDAGLTELLRALVAIPSVDPELTSDPGWAGEARMAAFVAAWLAERGFRVEQVETAPGRPNVVARHGPERPRRVLLIEGHLDTQGVHGMTVDPFAGEVRGGRLYGRGASDTKGPIAAALWALSPARRAALAGAGVQVVFAGAVGEERGNLGAKDLAARGVGADEAVVLEPTGLHVVHAHKGTLWFAADLEGRAAHGSDPGAGVNAAEGAAALIERLRAAAAAEPARHPALGGPTLSTGLVRGGASVNVVPDRCTVEWDRRTLPGEREEAILETARRAVAALTAEGRLTGGQVRKITSTPPFETAADSPLVRRLRAAAADEGVAARAEGSAWYSDAGPFAATCRSLCVFGPGHIAQAHTADEYINLADLDAGARILGRFLERTAAEAGEAD